MDYGPLFGLVDFHLSTDYGFQHKCKVLKCFLKALNPFRLFAWNRKHPLLCPDEVIFQQHSRATVFKNDEIWVQNGMFAGKTKSLNEFIANDSLFWSYCVILGA